MRLGQMARKLGITPSDIAQHLASQGIVIDENANTKLDESHIETIVQKFAPGGLQLSPTEQAQNSSEPLEPVQSEILPDSLPEPVVALEPEDDPINQDLPDEQNEVIKAQKISLTGLKVLGKIELPESKKDEPQPLTPADAPRAETGQRNNYQNRKNTRDQRSYKNPVSLQREQEIKQEQERRKDKAALDKERKTQNYLKKVTMSPPTKAVRMVDEPLMQMTPAELKEEPTGLWARFIRWLST